MTEKQIDALPIARIDADACKALKAAASEEETRPTLHYALVREGFVEATNGHVLCRVALGDASGEEFSLPEEIRGRRWLVHRAMFDHVKPGHAFEIDMQSGECWVVGEPGEEGYPLQLPPAQTELEGQKFPNTDAVMPKRNGACREVMIGGPVLKAMLAFAGSGKAAGSLHLIVPEEDEKSGHIQTAIGFKRQGEGLARTGLVMPMRIYDKFEQVGEDANVQTDIEGVEAAVPA